MRNHRKETLALWGFVLVWLSLNLLLLTRYPLVHSDESWLGGLTRNMKNVPEWARKQGYNVEVEEVDDGEWDVIIEK